MGKRPAPPRQLDGQAEQPASRMAQRFSRVVVTAVGGKELLAGASIVGSVALVVVELGREVPDSAAFKGTRKAEAGAGATSFSGPEMAAVAELVEVSTAVRSTVSAGPESRTMQAGRFDRVSARRAVVATGTLRRRLAWVSSPALSLGSCGQLFDPRIRSPAVISSVPPGGRSDSSRGRRAPFLELLGPRWSRPARWRQEQRAPRLQ